MIASVGQTFAQEPQSTQVAASITRADSASDIQAGHAFGCKSCAVTCGLGNREKLLAENADIVVSHAGDLLFLVDT